MNVSDLHLQRRYRGPATRTKTIIIKNPDVANHFRPDEKRHNVNGVSC